MTRFFATASLLAVSFAASQATADLVHHYSFDDLTTGGNATDSVGGATGIWDGPANTNVAVTGIIGTASQTNDENNAANADFNEHYTTGNLTGLDGASALSISLWFRLDVANNNNSTYNGLFMTRNLLSSLGGGSGENWGIALENNNTPRHIDWRTNGSGGTETNNIVGNVSTDWNHVVFVWDGVAGTRSLYQNGALIVSQSAPTGTITSGNSWEIGNDTCCDHREFSGTLDDISVWSNALTEAEVGLIYNGGLAGNDAPTSIPEPSSLALLGLGGLLIARRRRG